MKKILFLILLLPALLPAQTEQPPKIRLYSGFLSKKYELGDKEVKPADIRTHLQKYDAEAYHIWRKADAAGTSSVVFAVLGAIGTLVGATANDNHTAAGAYLMAAGMYTVCLVGTISHASRQEKAAKMYNVKYVY